MSKLVAELLMVFGGVLAGVMVWKIITGLQAKNWPTVPGSVIDSQVTMHYDDDGDRMYGAAVSYHYSVDGLAYSSNKRTFADYNSSNRRRAEKIVAQYAPGTSVQVYYRPDDPEDAVLEPGTNATMFLLLLVPLIFLGLGAAGLLGLI